MTSKEKLEGLMAWAEQSHAYLSTSTDYAKGYKDGIANAKEIVLSILNN